MLIFKSFCPLPPPPYKKVCVRPWFQTILKRIVVLVKSSGQATDETIVYPTFRIFDILNVKTTQYRFYNDRQSLKCVLNKKYFSPALQSWSDELPQQWYGPMRQCGSASGMWSCGMVGGRGGGPRASVKRDMSDKHFINMKNLNFIFIDRLSSSSHVLSFVTHFLLSVDLLNTHVDLL